VSGAVLFLSGHPWIAIAASLASFLLLFAALQVYARLGAPRPETTRKLLHTGSGALTLAFPFLFRELWPVLLLTGASALLIGSVKFVRPLRALLGRVTNRVDRTTMGELYFPASVALLFWLTLGEHPLLFVIPVLMLTLADATGALVGERYGFTPYTGTSKSVEGSIAFVVVAFFCVHVPLLLWSEVGRTETLLIASTLALLVMLLEGSAWRGLDNLFIPIGGYFLLRVYVTLDAGALLARLVVTLVLVALIMIMRRRSTLGDDSLVAAAFLCYAWLSPPTPDNSRRMHDVHAVLWVWAAAVAWLMLARSGGRDDLLFPYTIVFAANLAMFGISRLATQFPDRPLGPLFWRAVLASWAIVMVPFVAVAGVTAGNLTAAAGAVAAIALGAATFVRSQPEIRDTPMTTRRWLCQAGAASLASVAAWLLARLPGFLGS
jgi:phytol kinase